MEQAAAPSTGTRWEWVGKIGLLVAVSWGVIQLYDRCGPAPGLEAEIRFGETASLAPAELLTIADVLESEDLAKALDLDWAFDPFSAHDVLLAKSIVRSLDRRYMSAMRSLLSIGGYWHATIRNNGSRSLQGVTVVVPRTIYASVTRQGIPAMSAKSTEVVSIGAMRPGEVVTVEAWTTSSISNYELDSVRLTHQDGLGEVKAFVPVGPLGRFVDSWWFPLFILMVSVLFMGIMTIVLMYGEIARLGRQIRSDNKPASPTTSDTRGGPPTTQA